MTDVVVFVDLEETLVDVWHEGNFLEVGLRRTRKLLDDLMLDSGVKPQLGLMSWAVWDSKDLVDFNRRFRGVLESELRTKFAMEHTLSMDDWSHLVLTETKKRLSRQDMFDMFGKEEVLSRLVRSKHFLNTKVFLVDDRVSHNLHVECPEFASSVTFLNVNEMSD